MAEDNNTPESDAGELGPEATEEPEQTRRKTQKSKKGLKRFGIGLGGLLAVGLLYLGWLGFIPGLSNLLGANSPKDLGVTYSEADLQSFYNKTAQKLLDYANAPLGDNGKKVIFADSRRYTAQITQAEVTARINASNWAYMPVKNVQVRFSDDNRVEVSGNIDVDALEKFIPFIGGVGYSSDDVQTGLSWLRRLSGDPAFYIDASGAVSNNNLNLKINSAKIGRLSAPQDAATRVLTTATENALAGTAGLDIHTASFSDGQMTFDGSAPTTIYVKNR